MRTILNPPKPQRWIETDGVNRCYTCKQVGNTMFVCEWCYDYYQCLPCNIKNQNHQLDISKIHLHERDISNIRIPD